MPPTEKSPESATQSFVEFSVKCWEAWIEVAIKASKVTSLEGQDKVFYAILEAGPSWQQLVKVWAEKKD